MNGTGGPCVRESIAQHEWEEKDDKKWKWNDNKFNNDINKMNTASSKNTNGDKQAKSSWQL